MSFTDKQVEQLQAPLDGALVKTRQQAGRALSYIEGWAAIDKANQIFGHGEWSYNITRLEFIGQREVTSKEGRKGHEVAYYAIVLLSIGPYTRYEDTGYGSGTDYNSPFSAHESATKEAVTDALKRCFKNLGYPFGLALYDKTQEHVDRGESTTEQPSDLSLVQPPATDEDRKGFEKAMVELGYSRPHARNKAKKMAGADDYMAITRAELASIYKTAKKEKTTEDGEGA